jgi:putative methyltransferase (TIGR04325 family)
MFYQNNKWTYIGVFRTNADAKLVYDLDDYVNTEQNERDYQAYLNSHFSFYLRHSVVPIFVAGLAKKNIRILDIGAGYFSCYHYLLMSLPLCSVNVVAIERDIVVSKMREQPIDGLIYTTNLSQIKNTKFDIVYFGSSYQYFLDETERVLDKYLSLGANYIIISDTRFSEINESFVTVQNNMHPSLFSQKIYNLEETIKKFRQINYNLVYISKRKSELHDSIPERQINARELIFKKIT